MVYRQIGSLFARLPINKYSLDARTEEEITFIKWFWENYSCKHYVICLCQLKIVFPSGLNNLQKKCFYYQ